MKIFSGLVAGLIFGLGLVVSGMANPAKVLNFLDLFGVWDPSLAFVMGGAIAIALPGFKIAGSRAKPLFAEIFQMPTKSEFDMPLIIGAIFFGIGWGIGGFCPGPAMTAIFFAAKGTFVFVPAMIIGMWIAKFAISRKKLPFSMP